MSQQSIPFRPFMREFIALVPITGRAGNYYIVNIMTRRKFRTGNMNNMIKIIDVRSIFALLEFVEAIIASILLRLQFRLNLLSRECAYDVSVERTPPLHLEPSSCAIHFRPFLSVLLSLLKNSLPIILIALSVLCEPLFPVNLMIPPVILLEFFRVCGSIVFSLLFYALFTVRMQVSPFFIL